MSSLGYLVVNSSLFAAAMGWLEGIVVVYLRSMYPRLADWKTIEISREAATLVMLVCFALVAGRNRRERWGILLWIFGVWDIIYYACLWTWLKWPACLTTMDTLFYIPCVWSAPVWVPVMFSLIMMLAGYYLMINRWTGELATGGWWLLFGLAGGVLVGIINAWFEALPPAVSIMGMSVCVGLTAFGAGMGSAAGPQSARGVFKTGLTIALALGIAGGMLGHVARSVFYHSHYSIWWPVGAGMALGMVGLIVRRRARLIAPLKTTCQRIKLDVTLYRH